MTDFWVIYKIQRDGTKKFLYRSFPKRWITDFWLAKRFTETEAVEWLDKNLAIGKRYAAEHYTL